MPLGLFEVLSLLTVALALAMMRRRHPPLRLGIAYASLAVAGFVGEETMILAYRFYAYAPGWHARLLDVPVLVPLIWPLVVLSARDVVVEIGRGRGLSLAARAALVGAFVVFDASLVEVVAVRAGLWSWAEPGHLGVPFVGILGWGFFAGFAVLPWLSGDDASPSRTIADALFTLVAGPVGAHVLVLTSWWLIFRSLVRGDTGSSVASIAVAGSAPLALAVFARSRGATIPLAVAAPRIVAALLFVALLVTSAGADPRLLAHTAAVAVPYIVLTRPWSFTVPQQTRRELC
jgi:hypothetical protein